MFNIDAGSGHIQNNIVKNVNNEYKKFVINSENIKKLDFFAKLENDDYEKITTEDTKKSDFLCFAAGVKPAYYSSNIEFKNIPEGYHKITIGNNQMLLLNDKNVKEIIQNNLQLFNALLDTKDLSVDNIYKLLSSDNEENPLKQKPFRNDILGIVLGFPKLSAIIFNLTSLYGTKYKTSQLIATQANILEYLQSEDCFYKNKSLKDSLIKILQDNILISDTNTGQLVIGISQESKKSLPLLCKLYINEPKEIERIETLYREYSGKLIDLNEINQVD